MHLLTFLLNCGYCLNSSIIFLIMLAFRQCDNILDLKDVFLITGYSAVYHRLANFTQSAGEFRHQKLHYRIKYLPAEVELQYILLPFYWLHIPGAEHISFRTEHFYQLIFGFAFNARPHGSPLFRAVGTITRYIAKHRLAVFIYLIH